VFRYKTNGQYVSEATDQATTDKAGSGKTVTFTDTTPNTAAPCYQVDAYDYAGSFVAGSDIVCPAPNVLGQTQSAATSTITTAHFTLGTVSSINNCVSTGTVRSQNPTAGTGAPAGAAVNITVSTCTVPNVLGADFSSSTSAIIATGLVVGTVSSVNNCVKPGTVWSTNPSVGTAMSPGSTVNITMATCTVPNVLSFDQTSAVNSIHAVGLNVHIGSINNCLDPGTVQSENPSSGTSVAPGSTVNITISTCTGGGNPK
jgi:beta-lactam-binding protein with PASTA domain